MTITRFALVLSLMLMLKPFGYAQESDSAINVKLSQLIVSSETYNRVLDIVFPKQISDDEKTDWTLTLRFMPHSEPESQIVIRKSVSQFTVVEYRSANGV